LHGVSQARVSLTEMRSTLNGHIDKIQTSIITNEGKLRDLLDSIQRRVAKMLPDTIVGGEDVKIRDVRDRIREVAKQISPSACFVTLAGHANAVLDHLESLGLFTATTVNIRWDKQTIAVGDFRIKLYVSKTDIYRPTQGKGPVTLSPGDTFDGVWIITAIGKNGEALGGKDRFRKFGQTDVDEVLEEI
jgi:hypothetical protein